MRARRVDANHAEVKLAFERLGCSVLDVSGTPCGFDLIVGFGGLSICVEVKDGAKPPSRRKLTRREREVHDTWKGGTRLVIDPESVVETVRLLQHWRTVISRYALQK